MGWKFFDLKSCDGNPYWGDKVYFNKDLPLESFWELLPEDVDVSLPYFIAYGDVTRHEALKDSIEPFTVEPYCGKYGGRILCTITYTSRDDKKPGHKALVEFPIEWCDLSLYRD